MTTVVTATVLFALVATARAGYRLVIMGDRTGGHQEDVHPSIIREINPLKPDIIVTAGDQIEGYGDDMEAMSAEWDSLLTILDQLEAPVYLTAGNHDIWSSGGYMERMKTQPVSRGEFFQFCWLTVDDDRFDMAVIDAGNIYPSTFHTVEDDCGITMIESDHITINPLHAPGAGGEAVDVVVTIENHTPVVLDDAMVYTADWQAPIDHNPNTFGELVLE